MTFNFVYNNTAMCVWRCPLARVGRSPNSNTGYSHSRGNMIWRTVITYKNTAATKKGCHISKTQVSDIKTIRAGFNNLVGNFPVTGSTAQNDPAGPVIFEASELIQCNFQPANVFVAMVLFGVVPSSWRNCNHLLVGTDVVPL